MGPSEGHPSGPMALTHLFKVKIIEEVIVREVPAVSVRLPRYEMNSLATVTKALTSVCLPHNIYFSMLFKEQEIENGV